MSENRDATTYTLRQIEGILGLGRNTVTGLVRAGFVTPARGPRNEYRFSFQDVVLLRTAHHLQAANIPPRRLLKSLRQLRAKLPAQAPLAGLRIRAIGNDVAVRQPGEHWEAATGQWLLDFEVASLEDSVSFMQRAPDEDDGELHPVTAAEWFARGERLESTDVAGAEAAYREALELAPDHAYASLNLGALLCEARRCGEAVRLYDLAIARSPDTALLHFNRAIALEDDGRDGDALESYERCLALDPEFGDAHYNAARLHERLGDSQAALRHYSAYRRIEARTS